jgi:hypothetical protein
LFVNFFGLSVGLLDDLVNICFGNFFLIRSRNDLSGSVPDHLGHLLTSHFGLRLILTTPNFIFLNNKVISLEFDSSLFDNLLFNCIFSDETVDDYLSLLTNSVSSVDGLEVDLGIPV